MSIPVSVLGDLGSFAPLVNDFGSIHGLLFDHSSKLKPEIQLFLRGFHEERGADFHSLSQSVEAAEQCHQITNKDSQTYGNLIQVEDLVARANICKTKIEALLEREKLATEERNELLAELDKKLLDEKTVFMTAFQEDINRTNQDLHESEQLLTKKYSQ